MPRDSVLVRGFTLFAPAVVATWTVLRRTRRVQRFALRSFFVGLTHLAPRRRPGSRREMTIVAKPASLTVKRSVTVAVPAGTLTLVSLTPFTAGAVVSGGGVLPPGG